MRNVAIIAHADHG